MFAKQVGKATLLIVGLISDDGRMSVMSAPVKLLCELVGSTHV